ncbi:type VI secretion system-associated protein TagO [Vannielia litorea]|uniref:Type VI secretion system VasI, EvfG, VC_A0118 n=1 Tax=Vannielia litorea TaxID=1217970 RepID=A0A1N6EI94_9RHOB|nr:type VI secretion system-associated protein TagO [Vannielia litorea]SIN82745.1 Type VI secretion system VasI, EvfG, VC_A0118 [Vannielia litorea]
MKALNTGTSSCLSDLVHDGVLGRNSLLRLALLLASVGIGMCCAKSASAQDSIARCVSIKNEVARLNCYDAAASSFADVDREGRPVEIPTKPTVADGTGKWNYQSSSDPLTDEAVFTAYVTSDYPSAGRDPILFVRCKSNSIDAYIAWNEYLSDNTTVTVRFGDDEPETSNWASAVDETATFVPGGRLQAFLTRMMTVDKLTARIQPYREGPVTAVFDLTGMKTVFDPYRDLCRLENS